MTETKTLIRPEDRVRCKKMVMWSAIYQGGHSKQCKRYAVKDGFCKVHHPDEVYKRGEKRTNRMPVRLWGLFKFTTREELSKSLV